MSESVAEVEARTGKPWYLTHEGRQAHQAGRTPAPTVAATVPEEVVELERLHADRVRVHLCAACGRDLAEVEVHSENPNGQRITCDSRCRQRLSRQRRKSGLGPLH